VNGRALIRKPKNKENKLFAGDMLSSIAPPFRPGGLGDSMYPKGENCYAHYSFSGDAVRTTYHVRLRSLDRSRGGNEGVPQGLRADDGEDP
jgi:hypothetical protein